MHWASPLHSGRKISQLFPHSFIATGSLNLEGLQVSLLLLFLYKMLSQTEEMSKEVVLLLKKKHMLVEPSGGEGQVGWDPEAHGELERIHKTINIPVNNTNTGWCSYITCHEEWDNCSNLEHGDFLERVFYFIISQRILHSRCHLKISIQGSIFCISYSRECK